MSNNSLVKVTLTDDKERYALEYPNSLTCLVSQIANRKDDKIPVSYSNTMRIIKAIKHHGEWSDEAKEAGLKQYEDVCSIIQAKTNDPPPFDHPRWDDLSPLQKQGAYWLAKSPSAILADEMGSGKTVQSCMALNMIQPKTVLIVCPLIVLESWEKHLKEWTDIAPLKIRGSFGTREFLLTGQYSSPVAFLIGWPTLRLHSKLKHFGNVSEQNIKNTIPKSLNHRVFDVIIADEVHRAKDPKASQTRALWALEGERRWCLSGTPVANSPLDFWSILHYMEPNSWKSRVDYVDSFLKYSKNSSYVSKTILPVKREMFDDYTGHLIHRRKLEDIIGRKIGKIRTRVYCQLSKAHREVYDMMRDQLYADLESGHLSVQNALVKIVRLLQLAGAMIDVEHFLPKNSKDGEEPDFEEVVNLKNPCPKSDVLNELLNDLTGSKVVIMAQSKKLIDLCLQNYASASNTDWIKITGDVPIPNRPAICKQFTDGPKDKLFATIGTIGEGLDLSCSGHMIMVQRPFSLIQSKQAEDRITRWTQTRNSVNIIDIVTEDTIDHRVLDILNEKYEGLADFTKEQLLDVL